MSKINVITGQQALLSEKLLLLKQFDYAYNEPTPLPFHKTVQIELELLDAIASILTTRCEDTFAAAFDKSKGFVEIVLAKSGKPTMEDKEFAKEFFEHIFDPNAKNATDVFPFLLKHRRGYLNTRIKKLHAISTDPKFNRYFDSLLELYVEKCTDSSLEIHFPQGHSNLDKDKEYYSLLKEYLTQTQAYSKADLNASVSEAHDTFFRLNTFSETLANSTFMQKMKGRGGKSDVGRKAGKFIRNAEKLGRYIRGVRCLLKYAKRLLASGSVIPHRWVEDIFTGTGEGEIQFQAKNAYQVVCRIRETNSLPAKHSENLDKVYPSNREPWGPLFAYLHPEMRIILSSLLPKEWHGSATRGIGLSKQPCLSCLFWIKYYNRGTSTNWVMNNFWGKPDPTFALPGDAYLYTTSKSDQEENFMDRYVERDVYMKLEGELQWFLKRGYHYK